MNPELNYYIKIRLQICPAIVDEKWQTTIKKSFGYKRWLFQIQCWRFKNELKKAIIRDLKDIFNGRWIKKPRK